VISPTSGAHIMLSFMGTDRVFGFHLNARHLKLVIAECMISTFKHRQLLSSMCIFAYHV